jgi:hypothetical protein
VGELPPAFGGNGVVKIGGLGQWVTDAVAEALDQRQGQFVGPANDPSRTNADGGTFVFESRAELAGYENEGHSEIYRYDYGSSDLSCVSCSPIGAPAASDARIESRYAPRLSPLPPVNAVSTVENVVAGGGKVFFQSADRLVPGDLDGKIDVYEWEAHGAGGCASGTGCLSLISAGRSAEDEYLYAVGDDGRDVFLWSGDLLTAQDLDGAPSIYDAREGGGLPAPPTPPGECLGEACQPSAVARDDATPGSSSFMGSGNLKPHVKSCHRSKHKGRARRGRRHCGRRRHANRRAQR